MGIHIIYSSAKHLMCTVYLLTYLVLGWQWRPLSQVNHERLSARSTCTVLSRLSLWVQGDDLVNILYHSTRDENR